MNERQRGESVHMTNELCGTAYHEAGHAIVAFVLGFEPQKKGITIISNGSTAGEVGYEMAGKIKHDRARLCVVLAGPLSELCFSEDRTPALYEAVRAGMHGDAAIAAYTLSCIHGKNVPDTHTMLGKAANYGLCALQNENMADRIVRGGRESFHVFFNQFTTALNQSNLPEPEQPDVFGSGSDLFRELHSAAHDARNILYANLGLVRALHSRLLRVRSMSGIELTAFLEGRRIDQKRDKCCEGGEMDHA